MYSTCLFCHALLGANTVIEPFPVGSRLAFDSNKGRLWLVCPACAQWNLTPLEERWEAIEQCERLFRATPTRMSTDNVGLARHASGTDLIRVGSPLLPEYAGWRYGTRLGRRRWRAAAGAATGIAAGSGAIVAGIAAGVLAPAVVMLAGVAALPALAWHRGEQIMAWWTRTDGETAVVRRNDLPYVRLANSMRGEGWRVLLGNRFGVLSLEDADAERALDVLLPFMNGWGADRDTVQQAVTTMNTFDGDRASLFGFATRLTEQWGGSTDAPRYHRFRAASQSAGHGIGWPPEPADGPVALGSLAPDLRLALEMALHEDTERRAVEGDLDALQDAWREAEEVAAISDDLLLPARILAWLRTRGRLVDDLPRPTPEDGV